MSFLGRLREAIGGKQEAPAVVEQPKPEAPEEIRLTKAEWDYVVAKVLPEAKSDCRQHKKYGMRFSGRTAKHDWIKARIRELAEELVRDPEELAKIRAEMEAIRRREEEKAERRRQKEEAAAYTTAAS